MSHSHYKQSEERQAIEQPDGCIEAVYETTDVSNQTHDHGEQSLEAWPCYEGVTMLWRRGHVMKA